MKSGIFVWEPLWDPFAILLPLVLEKGSDTKKKSSLFEVEIAFSRSAFNVAVTFDTTWTTRI